MCLTISSLRFVIGHLVMELEATNGGSDLREAAHTNLKTYLVVT
jgi:hypothetical protein